MRGTRGVCKGEVEQAGSSSSTNETERKWQDKVDGVNDKRRKVVKRIVHFGEPSCPPKEKKDEEEVGEKAVATLSLSVQLPVEEETVG